MPIPGGHSIQFSDGSFSFSLLPEGVASSRYDRIALMDEPYGSAAHLQLQQNVTQIIKTREPSGGPFIDGKTELVFKFKVAKNHFESDGDGFVGLRDPHALPLDPEAPASPLDVVVGHEPDDPDDDGHR